MRESILRVVGNGRRCAITVSVKGRLAEAEGKMLHPEDG
jgi:hypothetical protein